MEDIVSDSLSKVKVAITEGLRAENLKLQQSFLESRSSKLKLIATNRITVTEEQFRKLWDSF